MSDALAVYLHDHLAGSNFGIELLKNLHQEHASEPLGQFASAELAELEREREVLEQIIERVGVKAPALKEAATWFAEKISRFKLSHASSGEFGTFEALEALGLGISGRIALWRTLAAIAPANERVRGPDFDALAARAEEQYERVEERRVELAGRAFNIPRK